MLKTLVGAFKNKDIRKKILYTLMILVIVRVGSLLPIPGVDTEYFSSLLSGINTGDLSYLSAFTLYCKHNRSCCSTYSRFCNAYVAW